MSADYAELRAYIKGLLMARGKSPSVKTIRNSAGCVIHRFNPKKDRIEIVLGRVKGSWGIPKGHVEDGESLAAAAIRESFEETSLLIELGSQVPVKAVVRDKVVTAFLATVSIGTNDAPSCPVSKELGRPELDDVKWVPIDKLPNLVQYQAQMIDAALSMIRRIYAK